MFSFIKNFTNYGPKSFKGKSAKDILAMTSSKVPDDFFSDAYTQAHLQEFMDADLSEEQENAIDLLSDLKNKPEIIRKCYDKRKKRSQRQQAQQPQAEQPQAEQPQAQAQQQQQQTSDEQQAELLEEPAQAEQQPQTSEQQQQTSEQMNGGGRRKRTRKGKRSKYSKKTKRSKKGKKSKRVRFSV